MESGLEAEVVHRGRQEVHRGLNEGHRSEAKAVQEFRKDGHPEAEGEPGHLRADGAAAGLLPPP